MIFCFYESVLCLVSCKYFLNDSLSIFSVVSIDVYMQSSI